MEYLWWLLAGSEGDSLEGFSQSGPVYGWRVLLPWRASTSTNGNRRYRVLLQGRMTRHSNGNPIQFNSF